MYISRCALSISLLVLVASLLLVLLASIGLPASAAPAAPAQPLRYYHLAGEVFQPRPAGVVDFYGDGCLVNLYGQTLWAPVVLPEGSVLKSVRLYFLDDSVLTMTLSLEAFHDGRSSETLTRANTSGSAGYSSTASPEITQTVEMSATSYMLRWDGQSPTSSADLFCGARVDYYAPPLFGTFLPTIQR